MTMWKFAVLITFMISEIKSSDAQSYLGNFRSYSAHGKKIVVLSDTSGFNFVLYKPNLVRVDFLSTLAASFDSSLVVVQDTSTPVSYSIKEDDSTVTILTSSLEIICRKFPLRVGFYAGSGTPYLIEPSSGGACSIQSKRVLRFSMQSNEHFYGTGERGMSLDLLRKRFDSYNEQHGGYGSPAPPTMNVNIPFLISTSDYGIYFENTYEGHFDIGSTDPAIFSYTADEGELSYYFICAANMKDVLSDYTWLTGRAPLLPKWAYGYIQSKFGYRNDSDATQMIQRMRSDSIPCDAIVLDLYWFQNMGDLSWNTSSWPNPNQIMGRFISQGFKTIVITEPYITEPSSNFSDAANEGYLAKDSAGRSYNLSNWWSCGCNAGLLDITNPTARSWWWNKYYLIFSTGVSGVWTDLGEPERDYGDMRFFAGTDSKVHNIYDFLWAETLFNGFNVSFPNKRLFNLTRSGYAGLQRFGAVTWSGDVSKTFGGLAVQLPLLLNMGMSGIAYQNSDIGGFNNGSTTPELYARWMEFGAFCPVMRAHGYDGDNGTEPWAFGMQTEDVVRKMVDMRYSLLPYNYTMAHEAYSDGLPMARPLVLEYQDDPNVTNESSAYMWGDNLLVAPVVQSGQAAQTFYLPQGKWIDYWTDEIHNGGTNISVEAPLNEVPMLVRAGSIIPMQPVISYVDEVPSDTIILAIYPDPNTVSNFSLYEDDGKTLCYQGGAFATTQISESTAAINGRHSMRIAIGAANGNCEGEPANRVYVCNVHKVLYAPGGAELSNVSSGKDSQLTAFVSMSALRSAASGYYYDTTPKILYVKVPTVPESEYVIAIDSVEVTGMGHVRSSPSGYKLEQNYPNPFNPTTSIRYQLALKTGSSPPHSQVSLKLYDVLGREVATLVNEPESAGSREVAFDGTRFPSGVYFYQLTAGTFRQTRVMMLLK